MSKLAPTIGTRGTLRQCRRWDQQVPSIIHDSRQDSGSVMDDSGRMRQRGMQHTSSLSHQAYTATHQCFHHFMMSISKDRSEQSSEDLRMTVVRSNVGGKNEWWLSCPHVTSYASHNSTISQIIYHHFGLE